MMKTITRTPATSKAVCPSRQSVKIPTQRERYSDAEGRDSGVYWTIKLASKQAPATGSVSPTEEPPHSEFCIFQFGTLKPLVTLLEDKGWHRSRMVNLARVKMSEGGFQVEIFPTLTDARAAEAERLPRLGKVTRKHCCPFCMKSDALRETEWNLERLDGSEFVGPALICDRCDAVVPRARVTALGLIEFFPTLAGSPAVKAEASPRASKEGAKYCCPFCMKADQLRKTEWTHERADGSEFIGAALICERCDAVAPVAKWTARRLMAV
jgi:hypothetical protein